jgi:hypothetical protein
MNGTSALDLDRRSSSFLERPPDRGPGRENGARASARAKSVVSMVMAHALRVPVSRLDARLFTDDGVVHDVTLFLPPRQRVEHLFEGPERFVPLSEEGRVRIVARGAVAAISTARLSPDDPSATSDDEFLTERRPIVVRLRGGSVIEGTLRHGSLTGSSRTADLLNEPTPTFSMEDGELTYWISKAHVACVDEVAT